MSEQAIRITKHDWPHFLMNSGFVNKSNAVEEDVRSGEKPQRDLESVEGSGVMQKNFFCSPCCAEQSVAILAQASHLASVCDTVRIAQKATGACCLVSQY
eukprot:2083540-Amphidinium_carterae.1